MIKKNAFLLFEVTLTIAILSLGLVFVIRSLGMSVKVARASFNYSQAINFAYEKMFDFEIESEIDGLEDTSGEGEFVDNENFSWEYSIEQLSQENLGKSKLEISWREGKREGMLNVESYVKTRE